MIVEVAVPSSSQALKAFERIDYQDAFRAPWPAGATESVAGFTRRVFASGPGWVRTLMRLRHGAVRWLGLKTEGRTATASEGRPLHVGERLGIFEVMAIHAHEVLLGTNDRHLDFRVSVLRGEDEAGPYVVLSTVVHFHGALGRAYFLAVEGPHPYVVKAVLKKALAGLRASMGNPSAPTAAP